MNSPARRPLKPPSARTLATGALAASMLLGGVFGYYMGAEEARGRPVALVFPTGWTGAAILLGICGVSIALTLVYWRGLDEAAREAHKWAWFWGGSFALLAAVILLPVMGPWLVGADWPGLLGGQTPDAFIRVGVIFAVACQVVGYLAAWIGWWLWRR